MTTNNYCSLLGCNEQQLLPHGLCAFHSAALEVDGKTYADGHAPTVTVIEDPDA